MVTYNMLRSYDGKLVLSERDVTLTTALELKKMPQKYKITEIDPYVRTYC